MGALDDLIPDLPEEEAEPDRRPKWVVAAFEEDHVTAGEYVLTVLTDAPEEELGRADRAVLLLAAAVDDWSRAAGGKRLGISPQAITMRLGFTESTATQILSRLVKLGLLEWAVKTAGRRFARIPSSAPLAAFEPKR